MCDGNPLTRLESERFVGAMVQFSPVRDYNPPPFGRDVPLQQYLDDCPSGMTTRGTFFDSVQRAVGAEDARLYEGVELRRWHAFQSYRLTDFMRLVHNAARILHPDLPTGEGLRRIGWMSFPSFVSTMAGRVVLFSMDDSLEQVMRAAPKAYSVTLPGSLVRVEQVAEAHYVLEMRSVHSFVQTYHAGVIEGAVRKLGFAPDVRVKAGAKSCDAALQVTWRKA